MRNLAVLVTLLVIAPLAVAQSADAPQGPAPAEQAAPQPSPPPATSTGTAAPAQSTRSWRQNLFTWGGVGTTFAYGNVYGSLNGGVGYRMAHGLAPNVELSYNFGSSPTLWTLRPGVNWYLPVPRLSPWVGAYYTHWFVSGDRPDQNGVGGRAGISIGRALSLSVTYDHALNCSRDCDIWTPQVAAGFSL